MNLSFNNISITKSDYFKNRLLFIGFPGSTVVKNPSAKARDTGDVGLIPGSGRLPSGGNGNPLQYSCLKNSTDRGSQWVTVYEVAKGQTQLSE